MLDFNQKIQIHKIPREIFEEFPSLRQLKISNMYVLVLQDNFFSTDFVKIEYLDLSDNSIEEIEENALDNLVNLKWLNLESNELQALHSFEFRNNKKLEYISLKNNEIVKIDRRAFKNLEHLKFVQLEENYCIESLIGCSNCTIPEEDLENMLGECYRKYYQIKLVYEIGRIAYVDLSDSLERDKFTFDGTEEEKKSVIKFSFEQIPNLDYIPEEIFTEFPNLNKIEITSSKLPILKENLFDEKCEKIEVLWLWNNEIKIIKRKAFFHLKNLVEISLAGNKIQSLSENIFEANSKLEVVDLEENQIKALNPVMFKH
jgi:Leucine-rich repeat (LRR) protein